MLVILFIGFIVILSGTSFYFYHKAIRSSSKPFLNEDPDLTKSKSASKFIKMETDDPKTWFSRQNVNTVHILSNDGLILQGYLLEARRQTQHTVIIAHGYSGQARDMARYARFYYEKLGYNVLLPDARGHGASEGHYIGFGWHERKDYLSWINSVIERYGAQSKITLHGVSMGAATVLMTSGENLPKQVKAVVADCGYTSAKDVLTHQLKRMYHLPSFPLLQVTSLLTKLKAGYTFSEASALKQVKKASIPILFIHGEEDRFVPTSMVHQLYNAAKSKKELMLVPNATHGEAYVVNTNAYETKIRQFLHKYKER
ncbi:alpha/beta hydrolase [Halalkalibacter akibai]|uniref:Peptidase S9 prolyl oligopeptidase catalytic domain-containing protein n=1 Tax=Halalkalibacter akibai (strain ATCC 43226 / DSM 21942 / CIP 109018 / JCM 9157 / 1139) TaxID=1236973 RepID=W4QZY3_HALA3|nr:alpha/beta hydrolase [Halalkalibacter akibai]GAE36874.1 hypothetical protein JCM9157_4097 [Halalkalibacter akibai JCM 9157]